MSYTYIIRRAGITGKCAASEFECDNYDCVETSQFCDVSNDCTDGTDETRCLLYNAANQPVTVAPGDTSQATEYRICATGNSSMDQLIANLACL